MNHPEIQHAWARQLVKNKDYTDTAFLLDELKRIQWQNLLRNQNIRSTGDVYVVQHALRVLWQNIPRLRDAIFRSKAQKQSWIRSETMKAIALFQKNSNLEEDGQVGPQTIEKMVQAMEQLIESQKKAQLSTPTLSNQPLMPSRGIWAPQPTQNNTSTQTIQVNESVIAEYLENWKKQLGPWITWEWVIRNKEKSIVNNTPVLFYMRLRKDGDAWSESYVVIEDTLYHWNTPKNTWEIAPDMEIRNGKIEKKPWSEVIKQNDTPDTTHDAKRESDAWIGWGDSPPLTENPVIADAMNQKKPDQTKETAERSTRIESIVKDFMNATTLPFDSGGERVALDIGSGKLSIGEEVYRFPKPTITPTVALEKDTISLRVPLLNTSILKTEIPLWDILRLEPRTSGTFMIQGKNYVIERVK